MAAVLSRNGGEHMSFKEARKLARNIAGDCRTLTRQEVADALNVSLDVLDRMHKAGLGPPRFRSSPHRWCYPLPEFREWQVARLVEHSEPDAA